ncbi:hypothetical protein CBL_03179 [Carabus blaptoides fortunei]
MRKHSVAVEVNGRGWHTENADITERVVRYGVRMLCEVLKLYEYCRQHITYNMVSREPGPTDLSERPKINVHLFRRFSVLSERKATSLISDQQTERVELSEHDCAPRDETPKSGRAPERNYPQGEVSTRTLSYKRTIAEWMLHDHTSINLHRNAYEYKTSKDLEYKQREAVPFAILIIKRAHDIETGLKQNIPRYLRSYVRICMKYSQRPHCTWLRLLEKTHTQTSSASLAISPRRHYEWFTLFDNCLDSTKNIRLFIGFQNRLDYFNACSFYYRGSLRKITKSEKKR